MRISECGMRNGKAHRVSVDFVFRRERVAVFVDGCFWHACPRHGTMPAGSRAFWQAKLARNTERDAQVTRALRMAGWRVVRVWECALARSRAGRTMARITRALRAAQPARSARVPFRQNRTTHGAAGRDAAVRGGATSSSASWG